MMHCPEDHELLQRYARGRDDGAFGELVRRYIGMVYHAALRQTGGRSDAAADVAQQVFILLARKASALEQHRTIIGWLHTTTRNVTRDTLRSERRRRIREQEAFAMHERSRDEAAVDWESVRPVLDAAIGALDERDREAVLLRYFAALPLAEVGRKLGLGENAARMRIERALDKLGARLRRQGVTSSTAALGVALANPAFAAPAIPAGLAANVTTAALAGAAASSGFLGALGFMSTAKWIGGTAAALLVFGLAGIGTQQRRTEVEAALAAAQQEHARVAAEVIRAQQAAAAAEHQLALATARADEARKASAASPTAAQPLVTPPRPADSREELAAEGRAFLKRYPHVETALRDYVRANLKFRYGPVYRELGLTPEQIEKFENLRGPGTGMGASTADGRSMTLILGEALPQDFGRQIEAAIGVDAARRLVVASATAAARHVAAEVASTLYFTETPLAPAQADGLVAVLAAHRLPRNGGFDWGQVMAKAGVVLSAPQLEALAARRAGDDFRLFLNRPRVEAAKP